MEQTILKDVWKSVTITIGALSVMTFGPPMMLMWHVDSWDSGIQVQQHVYVNYSDSTKASMWA